MTLVAYSRHRRLGTIRLAAGKLTSRSPGLQDVADAAVRRAGGDAAKAYAALDGYCNGYITIITLPAEQDAAGEARAAAWDEARHPRGYGGRFGHGTGGGGHLGLYRDQISQHEAAEQDSDAKFALGRAGAAYADGDYLVAAEQLRVAAGRVGPLGRTADRDTYWTLAGAIDAEAKALGVTQVTQVLDAIRTEHDATTDELVAENLRNAERVITKAATGTSWRSAASGYLHKASLAASMVKLDDPAAARYDHLASQVLRLPDEQAPGTAAITALVAKAAPAVPGLLGGGDQHWNGKVGTFSPADDPDYLGYTFPDGHITLRTDVVNGLTDAADHPGKVMPDPDHLAVVLHELIHDTTGGRTAQDKEDWDALPTTERLTLVRLAAHDRHTGLSRSNYTLESAKSQAGPYVTKALLDSLTGRGLMTARDWNRVPPDAHHEHTWQLTSHGTRLVPRETNSFDDDQYTSASGHDIEEGFTELGSTQHMEEFAAGQGFGQVMTPRLSVAPAGNPPTIKQIYDVQDEVRDLYKAAGHVGEPGTVNGPGSLEAYVALSDAEHEMFAPHTDPAAFAAHLARAERAEPDPGVRGRIAALNKKLGITGGGTVDNTAWADAKSVVIQDLRDQAQEYLKKHGHPAGQQTADQLSRRIQDAIYVLLENDDAGPADDLIPALQHSGDKQLRGIARTVQADLNTLRHTPMARHDTVPEYARWLADPAKLAEGHSWGHYPDLTAAAQEWVQSAARAERKTGFGQQGTAGYKRTVELTDEINREGTAGKIDAMTRQVLRSMGIDPDTADPGDIAEIRDEIVTTYGDVSADGHGGAAAWKAARYAARRLARQREQGYQRQGGIMQKWAAAGEDDLPPIPAVSVTLTPAGATAARIRAAAWHDPARLAQAITTVRELAITTTDPAARKQVQDAGRSLRILAAIRAASPATAAT